MTPTLVNRRALVLALLGTWFVTPFLGQLKAVETIHNDFLTVTYDQGRCTLQAKGQARPFALQGVLVQGKAKVVALRDKVFGQGQAIDIAANDGSRATIQLFANLPFALCRATLINGGSEAKVLNKVPVFDATLDLGQPIKQLVALGTGRLKPGLSPEAGQLRLDGGGGSRHPRRRGGRLADS